MKGQIINPMVDFAELASGIVVPHSAAQQHCSQRPKAIDLFAGCGGMSLGLMQAGFEVVAGADSCVSAAITYMHNLGDYPCQFHFAEAGLQEEMERHLNKMLVEHKGVVVGLMAGQGWIAHEQPRPPGVKHFFLGDILKFKTKQILDAVGLAEGQLDCLAGGPPCQGYSTAGKQNVMDPRNSLVFEFCRIVCEIRPKTIIFENVPGIVGMVTPRGLPVIDEMCRILEDGGFNVRDSLVKAVESQTGSVGLTRGAEKQQRQQTPMEPMLF